MATTPKVYVICDKNCKFEGMTKEQIYTAILQAVNEGTIGDIDAGFVTTIKTINGRALKFFVGEQAEYDALTEEEKTDLFAIITNDTTKEGILTALETLAQNVSNILDGTQKVAHAAKADTATKANTAQSAHSAEIANAATEATFAAQLLDKGSGSFFSRKSVWSGSKTIPNSSYVNIDTNTEINNKYLIIQTEAFRTYPLRFDVSSSRVSITRAFEGIEIYVDNTNLKKVRIDNKNYENITVSEIFIEE